MSEEELQEEEEQYQEEQEENQEDDVDDKKNDEYDEVPFGLGQIKSSLGRFSKKSEETKDFVTKFVDIFTDLEEEENEEEKKENFFDKSLTLELNAQKGEMFLDLYHRFCIIQKVCQITYNEYQNIGAEVKLAELANNIIQILENDRNPEDLISEEYILFFNNIKINDIEYIQGFINEMKDFTYYSERRGEKKLIDEEEGFHKLVDILEKFQEPKDKNLLCILYLKLMIDSYRFFTFYSTYIEPLIPFFAKTGDSKFNMIQQVLYSFEKLIIPQNTLANNIYTSYLSDYKEANVALIKIKEISNDQGKAIEQSTFHYLLKKSIIINSLDLEGDQNDDDDDDEDRNAEEEDYDY